MVQMAGAYPRFLNMKHALEYCYSPLDGILVCRRFTPPPSPQCIFGKCTWKMHFFAHASLQKQYEKVKQDVKGQFILAN